MVDIFYTQLVVYINFDLNCFEYLGETINSWLDNLLLKFTGSLRIIKSYFVVNLLSSSKKNFKYFSFNFKNIFIIKRNSLKTL